MRNIRIGPGSDTDCPIRQINQTEIYFHLNYFITRHLNYFYTSPSLHMNNQKYNLMVAIVFE